MTWLLLLLSCATSMRAEPSEPLSAAYDALRAKDYDRAIPLFLEAVRREPSRIDIRKDLGYTYLKVGQSEAARDQFGEAMKLDPQDTHVALEYAYLCYESPSDPIVWKAAALRVFDRLRRAGNAQAEAAFQNIDRPLAEGIDRWTRALQMGPDNFSARYELAQLAEQRGDLELAANSYRAAWRLQPDRRSVLVDLGRVLQQAGRTEEAHASLLAASRGGEMRAAEAARELLPERYPYVYEFRAALAMDGSNVDLHRELAYLLLKMSEAAEGEEQKAQHLEAEAEFRILVASAPNDLMSCAQLGFLFLARKDVEHAMPLLKRVLDQDNGDLANKVRVALHLTPAMQKRAGIDDTQVDARVMADRSYDAGFMKDALRYLKIAHEADPDDYGLMLKLGFTENMLRDDESALVWFKLASASPDPSVASQARRAFANLRPGLSRIRTTFWMNPFYSTRWSDNFAYGQLKTELRWKGVPFHPYVSVRFVGDTRQYAQGVLPQALSESSFILGGGIATNTWHGTTLWGEAGTAVSYLGLPRERDIRGGVAWGRLWGSNLLSDRPGGFFEANADGVFVGRFGNDTLAVLQNKVGYTLPRFGAMRAQTFVSANITQDSLRQYWANFVEAGPGLQLHFDGTPRSLVFSVSIMRGVYTENAYNPRRPNFYDARAGFWYAFTR